MAIYPGAVWKPTPYGGKTPRNKQGRGILHVAVSARRSYPPDSANATWHMYVAHDGYCEQYVDSDHRAYASGDANDDAFQIETAGGLGSSAALNAERWTPAAVERLADIMAWLQRVDGTPLQLLPDSKPGRRGWGPHRLGIKHSAGPRPGWWQPGGEVWSKYLGKECPGDAKVAQIPAELLPRAQQIQNGDDDMPSVDEINWGLVGFRLPQFDGQNRSLFESADQTLNNVGKVYAEVAQVRRDLTAEAAKDAARDAAILAALQAVGVKGGADPTVVLAQVKAAADQAFADADFPTAEEIAQAVLTAQERDELARLRARVAELEAAAQPTA